MLGEGWYGGGWQEGVAGCRVREAGRGEERW